MPNPYLRTLDFDQWSLLARQDPERFEAMRAEMIEELLAAASEKYQRRLRGLQWQIDQVRARSSNPMAACLSLSKMMWETFAGEGGLVQALNRALPPSGSASDGVVLPFERRRKE